MIRRIALAALFLVFGSGAAHAALSCTLSASGVAFGTFSGAQVTTVGQITISCTGTGKQNYTMTLSTGSSGAYSTRQMSNGANRLSYNLYSDAAFTKIWGNGAGGSTTVRGTIDMKGATTITMQVSVYGRVPAQTTPAAGGYSDTIIANMTCGAGCSPTTSFLVTANVPPVCAISAANLFFGSYTGTQLDAQSQISITCANATAWTIGLNQGTFPGATVTTRRMTGPGNFSLLYHLFRDAARTLNWGNTVGVDTVSGTGSGSLQTLSVYGRLPASQTPGPGGYSDTITATLTY